MKSFSPPNCEQNSQHGLGNLAGAGYICPPMNSTIQLALLLGATILGISQSAAQGNEVHYGGPEGPDIYEDLVNDGTSIGTEVAVWDASDSLRFIPGYEIYRQWNTDVLFDRMNTQRLRSDTLELRLAYEECDHAMPCPGGLTSGFGYRKGRMHYGVDLDLVTGDPVVSAVAGMVRISKYNSTFGNVVVVRHFNGLETLYAHMSARNVEPGTLVEAGDTLGLGGNTGRSHGSHLHFEVRFLDQPIDPALVFDLSNGTLKAKTFDIHDRVFSKLVAQQVAGTKSISERKYHVVRKGDTLYGITRKSGVRVKDICRLNGIMETSTLSIGQRLRIN